MKRILTSLAILLLAVAAIVLAQGGGTARAGVVAPAPTPGPSPSPSPTPTPTPINFSPEEKSAETLYEGALMNASMLVEVFGPASRARFELR